jgi:hypothetical protein
MGKQVQVAMLREDEADFLVYLRTTATVRLFRSSAPTPTGLEVDSFDTGLASDRQFFVWNTSFAWQPEVKCVSAAAPVVERRGWAYLSNTSIAPAIEYDRHSSEHGGERIYWAKRFAAPRGLAYDVEAFERWYDTVARWIRKRGHRLESESHGPLYLPAAYAARNAA